MPSHPELRVLFCNLSSTVIDARTKSRVEKYAGGYKRFDKRNEKYREMSCILLCPEIYVGLYLENLMESAQHFRIIESAYYSIRWAHSLVGVNNPCDSEVITYIVDAASQLENNYVYGKELRETPMYRKSE